MSKWRVPVATRELGTKRSAAKTIAMPIGTFTKKIQRHPSADPPS